MRNSIQQRHRFTFTLHLSRFTLFHPFVSLALLALGQDFTGAKVPTRTTGVVGCGEPPSGSRVIAAATNSTPAGTATCCTIA